MRFFRWHVIFWFILLSFWGFSLPLEMSSINRWKRIDLYAFLMKVSVSHFWLLGENRRVL